MNTKPRSTSALDDRLARRKEHLMAEITTTTESHVATETVRRPRRKAVRLGVLGTGVAAVVAAAAVVGTSLLAPGSAATAFAVTTQPDGTVSITVVDSDAGAKQMHEQLGKQGYDVRFEVVPTSPQLVGTWLAFATADESASPALTEQVANPSATLEIPAAELRDGLLLTVGRAAHSGEDVAVVGSRNALAPGGLLHCLRLSGLDATKAARTLADAGYEAHWRDVDTHLTGTDHATVYRSEPTDGVVVTGLIDDPFMPSAGSKDVYLTTATPADAAYSALLWQGYAPTAKASGERDYSSC